MRIYSASQQAPCQMGIGETRCACPSFFNLGIRHSSGNVEDKKAGMIKITTVLYRGQAYFLVAVRCTDSMQYSWTRIRQEWHICLDLFNCRNSSFCHLLCGHTPSANSSSPTPPPLCPRSPPPSSLIEILPGTQTLPILGTELRERGRNTQEPLPIVWCPLRCVCAKHSSCFADQGTRQSNRYFPTSAFCENLLQF